MPDLISTREAAAILGLSERQVARYRQSGRLAFQKLDDGSIRLHRSHVMALATRVAPRAAPRSRVTRDAAELPPVPSRDLRSLTPYDPPECRVRWRALFVDAQPSRNSSVNETQRPEGRDAIASLELTVGMCSRIAGVNRGLINQAMGSGALPYRRNAEQRRVASPNDLAVWMRGGFVR